MKGYDGGDLWEAKRIATVVYTLLHDGSGRTKSLFGQLGFRTKIRYLDSVDAEHHRALQTGQESNFVPFSPLVVVQIDVEKNTTKIMPRLGVGFHGPITTHSRNFESWWEGTVYISDSGKMLSRKNLVFSLRTQDGGSHYDPEIRDEAYRDFSTVWTRRMQIFDGDKLIVPEAHLATMRQIAWELDESVSAFLKDQEI